MQVGDFRVPSFWNVPPKVVARSALFEKLPFHYSKYRAVVDRRCIAETDVVEIDRGIIHEIGFNRPVTRRGEINR